MQSETGFPSSHQLNSYVAYKCRLKLAARAVLSADAGLLVIEQISQLRMSGGLCARPTMLQSIYACLIFKLQVNVDYNCRRKEFN